MDQEIDRYYHYLSNAVQNKNKNKIEIEEVETSFEEECTTVLAYVG